VFGNKTRGLQLQLGISWDHWVIWDTLGVIWNHLGMIWDHLGIIWDHLGDICCLLVVTLVDSDSQSKFLSEWASKEVSQIARSRNRVGAKNHTDNIYNWMWCTKFRIGFSTKQRRTLSLKIKWLTLIRLNFRISNEQNSTYSRDTTISKVLLYMKMIKRTQEYYEMNVCQTNKDIVKEWWYISKQVKSWDIKIYHTTLRVDYQEHAELLWGRH
jgi:hypothetical protein